MSDLIAKFRAWDKDIDGHWSSWRKEARECFDFVSGRQWAEDDAAKLKEQNRAPVVFNRIGPIIDAVAGSEIMGRQQVQYLPREVNDTGVTELLTKGAEWIRDQSDTDIEESDAFRDAFICGLGFTETRMDYEEDPEGKILTERIDPLEMGVDPSARKPNLTDARYLRRKRPMSKERAEELFPGHSFSSDGEKQSPSDNSEAYDESAPGEDEVTICEWQWFETITLHAVMGEGGQLAHLDDEGLKVAEEANGGPIESVTQRQRRYWRAYTSGETVLKDKEPLPDGEFTWKVITGKRDRNKGTWYGLVRPMIDPQRWANKFFSQALHILNSNAKGGLIAEADAFQNQKQAEESWAKADTITWAATGSLERGAIQPKVAPPLPAAIAQLMEWSVTSIRDTTGINQEMLGMADRQQPGVLEHQRKQAAYGILAPFFDSYRRYRRLQGRLLLKYINKYLAPSGQLVRIVGEDGVAKYLPLLQQPDTMVFDVIVDEAPAGPNQKERVFALLSQFMPLLSEADPEIIAELVKYSPLPEALATKIYQKIMERGQPDPQQAQLQARGAEAQVAKVEGEALNEQADAAKKFAEANAAQAQAVLGQAVAPLIPPTGGGLYSP